MRSASPLWTRILGYGGAVVLVAVAVAVLLLQLRVGTGSPQAANSQPSAEGPGGSATSGAAGASGRPGAAGGPTAPSGGTGSGAVSCGSVTASSQRTGDGVKVSVTVPPDALVVGAFVDAKGRGTLTKGFTGQGVQESHVFEFTGVPAAITKRVGVTVATEKGMKTCVLPS